MNIRTVTTTIASASALSLAPAAAQTALRGAAQTPLSRLPAADHRDLSHASTNQTIAPSLFAAANSTDANTTETGDPGTCIELPTQRLSLTDAVTGELVEFNEPQTCPQKSYRYPDETLTNQTIQTDEVESGQAIEILQNIRCCTQPPAGRTRPNGDGKDPSLGPVIGMMVGMVAICVGICELPRLARRIVVTQERRAAANEQQPARGIEMRQGANRRVSDVTAAESDISDAQSDITAAETDLDSSTHSAPTIRRV